LGQQLAGMIEEVVLSLPKRRVFIGTAGANIVGQFGVIFGPFLLPMAMDQLAIDNLSASRFVAVQLGAFFLTALIAASVSRFSPRPIAVIGCLLFAGGSLGAAATWDFLVFGAAQVACGVGSGLALVASNRATASHHAFDRILAVTVIALIAFSTIGLIGVPAVFEFHGAAMAYLTLGGFAAVCGLASFGIAKGSRGRIETQGLSFSLVSWLLLGAYFLSRLSDATILPYLETFGARVGLTPSQVGLVLALTSPFAIMALWVGMRTKSPRGVLLLFIGGLLIKSSIVVLMLLFPTAVAFGFGQILMSCTVVLAAFIFMARFSEIDPEGRLAGYGSTVGIAADTAGLPIAAQVFAASSFVGIAWLAGGIGIAAVALCLISFSQKKRQGNVESIAI
jgi:hypothetical protein